MNNIELRQTKDGSYTYYNTQFGEHYHSVEGAYTESLHIYINNGLKLINKSNITIFEMGFGSGLNALLTFYYAQKLSLKIKYIALEKYPLPFHLVEKYPLPSFLDELHSIFYQMHYIEGNSSIELSNNFVFAKVIGDMQEYVFKEKIDLCYYDAFSYSKQPELWTKEIFEKIYQAMNFGGMLLTYSSKGEVKRVLREVGFEVKRFKGAGSKRHSLRCIKTN